jgi:hypothetical protein
MTNIIDDVRAHYRAIGLAERLKTARTVFGSEDQVLMPQQLSALDQFHTRAKAWFNQLRASGPPPSPIVGTVMGPDMAQFAANLGRNLMEGRLSILTAVFEARSIDR